MMTFRPHGEIPYWVAAAVFRGTPITLHLTEHIDEENLPDAAKKALAEVESRWESIERNLADSLLETYNEAWSVPEEGLPILSRDEFLRKIVLGTVQVDLDDQGESIGLYFGDSNLFAGHGVHLFWNRERMYPADLVG